MTKPREKTREELQAEIEDGKKKIRQLENREKIMQAEAIRRGTQGEKPQAYASAAASWKALCRSLLPCRTRMRRPFSGLP